MKSSGPDYVTVSKAVGRRIKALRTQHGWSPEDLAKRLRLSVRSINSIESGRFELRLFTLIRVARAFEIETVQLFQRIC
jgi:transcriptional regulator with XRE-family HTH domain